MDNQQPSQSPSPGPRPGGHIGGVQKLEEGIDALLEQSAEGEEEAALLEEAHALVSKALGQS